MEEIRDLVITVTIDEAEVKALAQQIGEKASPQDVDLSLMILGSKLAHEGHKVTLVSDDFKTRFDNFRSYLEITIFSLLSLKIFLKIL